MRARVMVSWLGIWDIALDSYLDSVAVAHGGLVLVPLVVWTFALRVVLCWASPLSGS